MNNDAVKTIYVVVGDKESHIYSYTWRIWWHGTSFYIKARHPSFDFKVSLHGPDVDHPKFGFIYGLDQSAGGVADSRIAQDGKALGTRFEGTEVLPGVRQVATLRFEDYMFSPGVPSEPFPHDVKAKPENQARFAAAPKPGESVAVHLFLTTGDTEFPNLHVAEQADALLGPLKNESGHTLFAVVSRERLSDHLSYRIPDDLTPQDVEDRVRGFHGGVDESGKLLLAEAWLSKAGLERRDTRGQAMT